jgi:hypothetical protein
MDNKNFNFLIDIISQYLKNRLQMESPLNINHINNGDFNILYEIYKTTKVSDTKQSFIEVINWLKDNNKNIVACCIFGSIINNSCSPYSISIPKENGEYVENRILVGPSDVDALILIKDKKVPQLKNTFGKYELFDEQCNNLQHVEKSLIENIIILKVDEFENSYIFSSRLYPMYYRMFVKGGLWIIDRAHIKEKFLSYAKDENEILISAKQFYQRRINSIIIYLQNICKIRVNNGFMY